MNPFDAEEIIVDDMCMSCKGAGGYSIGDCEQGIWENCEECNGAGVIDEDQ